jgi:predicted metal-dependent hydrolase
MLLIRMDWTPKKVWKVTQRTKRFIYKKKVLYGLREVRDTLVHELVHYRFPEMKHGRKFEARIKEILRGEEFPQIHITSPRLRQWR